MKDKLEKTGHKKGYYRLKSVLAITIFAVATAALAAIPVGISFKLSEAVAEENSRLDSSSIDEGEENSSYSLILD